MLEFVLVISSVISAAAIGSRRYPSQKVGIVVVVGLIQLAIAGYYLHGSMDTNLYSKHDISRGTSTTDLKRLFRKLSRDKHPDKIGAEFAQEYIEMKEDFEILGNAKNR